MVVGRRDFALGMGAAIGCNHRHRNQQSHSAFMVALHWAGITLGAGIALGVGIVGKRTSRSKGGRLAKAAPFTHSDYGESARLYPIIETG